MFDIGASELLVIVILAVLVIGPKDMPLAMRTAGRWIGKVRRVSAHFRTGVDAMIREAELEDMEKKWKEQNDAIMARTPAADAESAMTGPPASESITDKASGTNAEDRADRSDPHDPDADDPPVQQEHKSDGEPELPLGRSGGD